jgi:MFS family permease
LLGKLLPRHRRASMLTTLALLGVGVLAIVLSQDYKPAVRTFPLLVASLLVGLCVLDLIAQTRTTIGRLIDAFFSGGESKRDEEDMTWASGLAVAGAVGWITSFPLFVYLVGFMVTIPIYTLVSMKLFGKNSLIRAFMTTAILTVVVWAFFEYALGYRLFRGVLLEAFFN